MINNNKPLAFVIEDHAETADIFLISLQEAGFRTEAINDGLAAQRRLNKETPALVVLDVQLPEVSGLELLQQIRGDARLAATQVIMVTGEDFLAKDAEGVADLVMLKPVSYEQLRDLADRLRKRIG